MPSIPRGMAAGTGESAGDYRHRAALCSGNTRRSIQLTHGRNAHEASEQRRVGHPDRLARGDVGLRFTDDENRILELHVTGWCDVDITERALDDMGEPGLFGRHVADVREVLRRALDFAKYPDPSLGSTIRTSYRLTDKDHTSSGWYQTGGDMLMSTPELVLAVKDGVGSVSKGQGKKRMESLGKTDSYTGKSHPSRPRSYWARAASPHSPPDRVGRRPVERNRVLDAFVPEAIRGARRPLPRVCEHRRAVRRGLGWHRNRCRLVCPGLQDGPAAVRSESCAVSAAAWFALRRR